MQFWRPLAFLKGPDLSLLVIVACGCSHSPLKFRKFSHVVLVLNGFVAVALASLRLELVSRQVPGRFGALRCGPFAVVLTEHDPFEWPTS